MAIESFRKRFTFWLDLYKDDELALAEEIEGLKKGRQFTKSIRDGLRLITDLQAGRTDVLLELFPWVVRHFRDETLGVEDLLAALEDLLAEQADRSNHFGSNPDRSVSPVSFAKSDLVESQSTEDYLAEVFDDLDDIGF